MLRSIFRIFTTQTSFVNKFLSRRPKADTFKYNQEQKKEVLKRAQVSQNLNIKSSREGIKLLVRARPLIFSPGNAYTVFKRGSEFGKVPNIMRHANPGIYDKIEEVVRYQSILRVALYIRGRLRTK